MPVFLNSSNRNLRRLGHAVLYHSRRRSLSFRDIPKGLFGTHNLGLSQASVDTDALFDRSLPITFSLKMKTTAASPSGCIFEFGDSTSGIKLALNNVELQFAVGDGSPGNEGLDSKISIASLGTVGAFNVIDVAVNPGLGAASVWVNERLAMHIRTDPVAALLNGVWAADSAGSIAAAENGTSNPRVAVTGAPTGFVLVEPFTAYANQLPRFFEGRKLSYVDASPGGDFSSAFGPSFS